MYYRGAAASIVAYDITNRQVRLRVNCLFIVMLYFIV
jgi:hypothetical protein